MTTPRTGDLITTNEQLDALPAGSVLARVHSDGSGPSVYINEREQGWLTASERINKPNVSPQDLAGNYLGALSVLHVPSEQAQRTATDEDARAVFDARFQHYDGYKTPARQDDLFRVFQSGMQYAETTTAADEDAEQVLDDVIQHLRKIWSTGHDEAREVIDTAEELLSQALPRLLATARTRPTDTTKETP